MIKVGQFATSYSGVTGFVEKVYKPKNKNRWYCTIRDENGKLHYFPVDNLLIGG